MPLLCLRCLWQEPLSNETLASSCKADVIAMPRMHLSVRLCLRVYSL